MNTSRQLIVFDIDDTLYLERDYVWSGFLAVDAWLRNVMGVPGLAATAWQQFLAGTRQRTFDAAFKRLGVEPTPDLIQAAVAEYRSHRPAITLLPDAVEALDHFRSRSLVAVITDGPANSQQAKAAALRLAQWARPIVIAGELGADCAKPAPAAFTFVSEDLAVEGTACTYIADNPLKDFSAPWSLGWHTVRVRRPGSLHADIPSGPDVECEVTDLAGLWLTTGK